MNVTREELRELVDAILPDPEGKVVESISKPDEERIEQIVRRTFKDRDFEERILKIVKSIMSSFYLTMYTRRSFWKDSLKARD